MTFAQDQAISIGFLGIVGIDREAIEIEVDEDVGDRQRTTDVAGAGIEYRTNN